MSTNVTITSTTMSYVFSDIAVGDFFQAVSNNAYYVKTASDQGLRLDTKSIENFPNPNASINKAIDANVALTF